jgi:pyruvate formate lyase activating enzyme
MKATDLFITDIKHMDSGLHRKYTGKGNERILSNIKVLAESGQVVILRLPIIPNVNDSMDHIRAVSDYILETFIGTLQKNLVQVQLLRFRRLGEEKYASLGISYPMQEVDPPREKTEAHIRKLTEYMVSRGIPAVTGTAHNLFHD